MRKIENELRAILTKLHGCKSYSGYTGQCEHVEKALKEILKTV